MLAHAFNQAANNLQTIHVDIHQGKFLDFHLTLAGVKAVNQLGAIGTASTNNTNLQFSHDFAISL